jgi:hypothetical protein
MIERRLMRTDDAARPRLKLPWNRAPSLTRMHRRKHLTLCGGVARLIRSCGNDVILVIGERPGPKALLSWPHDYSMFSTPWHIVLLDLLRP